jgi:hypothetical protein
MTGPHDSVRYSSMTARSINSETTPLHSTRNLSLTWAGGCPCTSSTGADRFSAYAVRPGNFNIREYPPLQLRRCSTGCSERSMSFVAERDRLKKEQPGHNKEMALGGRQW